MATTTEYALLSLYVYDVENKVSNRPNIPNGWTLREYKPDNLLGLSYGVFKREATGEVVLAFTGTNNSVGDFQADLFGPLGLSAWQVSNAALVYQQTKEKYGPNITLSGHSLGGGLASVMATWFDRPAVVFDQAPFQLTAANVVMLGLVRTQLGLLGYSDPAMDNAISDFTARESRVASHHVQGEFLQYFRFGFNTAMSADFRPAAVKSAADAWQGHGGSMRHAA
jgi:hypothetical protein